MKILLFAIFAAFCASSLSAEYEGDIYNPQDRGAAEFHSYQRTFQLRSDPNAKIDRSFTIPVYFAVADKECYAFGSVIMHGSRAGVTIEDRDALRQIAIAAKLHGADAIILRPLNEKLRGAMNGKGPEVFVWAMAVRWGQAPL